MSCNHTHGWGPSGKAHCASCHRDFTTPSNFDRHRAGSTKHGRVAGVCHDPADVGLVLNKRGLWAQPGTDEEVPR